MRSFLFVYNAKSDFWSKKIDFAHKIISPNTYACSLCALTHGNFGETNTWKLFKKEAKFNMEFFYKNDFINLYTTNIKNFPVIIEKHSTTSSLSVLIDHKELSKLKTVEELIAAIKSKT